MTRHRSCAVVVGGLPFALGLASTMACSVDIRPLRVRPKAPEAIVIATFEDNDARPEDARFLPFQFYSFPAALPDLPPGAFVRSPIVSPGHDSNYALGLNWHLIDDTDGAPSSPGVGVRTLVDGIIDLSGYSRFTFGEKYTATAGCQAVPEVKVTFFCGEHNTAFMAFAPLTSDWSNAVLDFTDFVESYYPGPNGTPRADCFRVIDNIDFSVSMTLADGACGAGDLSLDDLSIRPPTGNQAQPSDAGVDETGDMSAPAACIGTPPASPIIADFSDAIAGSPVTFGAPPNITGRTYAYAAPGLTPPVLSVAADEAGEPGLRVVANPGAATTSTNTWLGFGVSFDACLDVSAFNAVRFTMTGDFGNCPIRFAAASSQTLAPTVDPLGSCTLANCYPPSIPLTSTGTTVVRFAELRSGSASHAGSPNLVDATALIGLQWQMDTPVGVGCGASFAISDLSFLTAP